MLLKARMTLNRSFLLLHSGLGDEGKRLLEEFSGTPHIEHIDTPDPVPPAGDEDEQFWETMGQEGRAQGFINDIQGLLHGK